MESYDNIYYTIAFLQFEMKADCFKKYFILLKMKNTVLAFYYGTVQIMLQPK